MDQEIIELAATLGLAWPAGILVRSLVGYLKPAWSNVDAALRPIINVLLAFALGAVLSIALHIALGKGESILYMLAIGIVAGVFAIQYEDSKHTERNDEKAPMGVMSIIGKVQTKKKK